MKVLGILGSPRKEGNSGLLLDKALEGARCAGAGTEKICLGDLNFKGCISCAGCEKTGKCVLADDMAPIYDKLKSADIVILASPIYFAGVPSQLKAMIDRCQSEWVAKYKLKVKSKKLKVNKTKKGAFICISGYKKDIFFKTAKQTIGAFFKTLGIDFSDELFFGGVEGRGDIIDVKGALKKVYQLGGKIVEE